MKTSENKGVRSISGITASVATLEGEGFLVHRAFPTGVLTDFDPFLLLDEMGPKELGPGEAKGAPDHPHRGFETVTYMLAGRMEHKDSQGNAGSLGPGDVQWMTAGAGVIHSEMPGRDFARTGGKFHGFQLWVNLPRRDKMITPRYQEIPAAAIPLAQSDDGAVSVKVIAGTSSGAEAVIETRTPLIYLHISIRPGGRIVQPVAPEYNAFAYVFGGEGLFGAEEASATRGHVVMFARDGHEISIANAEAAESPLEVLLIGGVPLAEPIARYGPFVMNTREEIYQAVEDFRRGRMGVIS